MALTEDGVLTVVDPTRKAIVRSDTGAVVGIFTQGYRVHRCDEWLVGNVEVILDADLQIGSAWSVARRGRGVWVQVEMQDTLSVEGVAFRPFLTAATSLEGSLASTYLTGAQVVVCDNTLSTALGSFREPDQGQALPAQPGQAVGRAGRRGHRARESVTRSPPQVRQLVDERVDPARWDRFVTASTAPGQRQHARADQRRGQGRHRLWHYDERVTPLARERLRRSRRCQHLHPGEGWGANRVRPLV